MSTGTGSQPDMTNHWILRIVALVIDSIIMGIIAGIIAFSVLFSIFLGGGFLFLYGFGYFFVLTFAIGILELIYFTILDVIWGGTLGKRIVGLQVQMVDGGKVTFGKSFIRNISKIWGLFLLLDWIIGIATSGKDPRQKYTDRIAGTTVVQVKQAFATVSPPPPPPPPPSA